MLTVQKFNDDAADEAVAIQIYEKLLSQTIADMQAMYTDFYKSQQLGEIVWKNKLMPIYGLLREQLFKQVFSQILEAQSAVGTVDAYCQILYAIFGNNATITVDILNPFHIMIDIVARYVEYFVWVDEQHKFYIGTEAGEYLGFASLVARLTNRQLADILKKMTNAGVFLEFTYKQENPDNGN